MTRHLLAGLLLGSAVVLTGTAASAQDEARAMSRGDVETIVREYLLANPEILVEVSQALSAKQQSAAMEKLFSDPRDAVIGNPDGSVVVAEFFDYNCPYCHEAYRVAQDAIAANPDLKIVLKEYPILGPESVAAHRVAVAVRQLSPESYAAFHERMFTEEGRATEEKALAIATDLGIAEDALQTALSAAETDAAIDETQELGMSLQVNGTPTYFDENGPFGFDQLARRTGSEG